MNMGERTTIGHLTAILTVGIWGTTFVATKVLLRSFTPVEILFFRFTLGYAALWIVAPRMLKASGRREELCFAAAGLSGVTLYFLLENIALTYSLASNVGVILAVSPLFTAVLARFFGGTERLNAMFVAGFAAAMCGIALIAFGGDAVLEANPIGDVLALLAALTWAIYSNLMKKIGTFGYDNVRCTRRIFFYGLVFMLPALYPLGFRLGLERFAAPVNVFNIVFLGLGASALCFATWNLSVKILGAVRTSVYIYAVPVINIVAAMIVLNEHITKLAALGTALTLAGLFLSEGSQRGRTKGGTADA
ncbi:DMT family transporter [Synergistaceae bacterium OttesenSCG-928-I11]|nr:DMT family transporter [Synergistaceae bacterium OttesenSCG-928-I11]